LVNITMRNQCTSSIHHGRDNTLSTIERFELSGVIGGKATSAGGMPFAQEHEAEAEAVEQSVVQSGDSHERYVTADFGVYGSNAAGAALAGEASLYKF
jgi:hypothetical protein